MAAGSRPQPTDGLAKLKAQLDDLQRQVDALRTQAPLRNSTISDGGNLVILDDDGNQVVRLGHDSNGFRGASFTTADGVDMLEFGISVRTPGQAALIINDNMGNAAFSPDPDGDGTGVFWPFVPVPLVDVSNTGTWPSNSTGSFVTIMQGGSEHFSQGLYVAARAVCLGGATAGQLRLLCDGSQVGSTAAVSTSVTTVEFRGVAGGTIRTNAFIELQARVTAGAGTCRAQAYDSKWVPFVLTT